MPSHRRARSVALATGSVISSSLTSRPSSVTSHRSVIPTATIGAAAYVARIRGSSCSADSVVSLIRIRSICAKPRGWITHGASQRWWQRVPGAHGSIERIPM